MGSGAEGRDTASRLAFQRATFKGPLPPPEVFDGYEQTLPGAADRILTLTEKQEDHRIAWEAKAQKEVSRGQIFGFVVAVLMIIGAVVCAALDQAWIGTALVGTSALGIVTAFIQGPGQ